MNMEPASVMGVSDAGGIFMKLHKKAAACLLAAAMAIFMMTACGNDSAPTIVNGVTYRNNVAPVAPIDSDSIKEQSPISAENSRYIAFLEKQNTEKTQYIAKTVADYEGTAQVAIGQVITAGTESYLYQHKKAEGKDASTVLLEKKDGINYLYQFMEDGGRKYAVGCSYGTGELHVPIWIPTGTLTSATVTVNGETYYAEIIRDGVDEDIACFRPNQPVPTYLFEKGRDWTVTEVYNEVVFGRDKDTYAQALTGCDVYTVVQDEDFKLVDEKGNTYVVTQNADDTYTVTKDGVDVTKDFQWFIKNFL